MTRDEYLRELAATEASVNLALALESGAVRQRQYRMILDGLSALRDSLAIGARPWEALS